MRRSSPGGLELTPATLCSSQLPQANRADCSSEWLEPPQHWAALCGGQEPDGAGGKSSLVSLLECANATLQLCSGTTSKLQERQLARRSHPGTGGSSLPEPPLSPRKSLHPPAATNNSHCSKTCRSWVWWLQVCGWWLLKPSLVHLPSQLAGFMVQRSACWWQVPHFTCWPPVHKCCKHSSGRKLRVKNLMETHHIWEPHWQVMTSKATTAADMAKAAQPPCVFFSLCQRLSANSSCS